MHLMYSTRSTRGHVIMSSQVFHSECLATGFFLTGFFITCCYFVKLCKSLLNCQSFEWLCQTMDSMKLLYQFLIKHNGLTECSKYSFEYYLQHIAVLCRHSVRVSIASICPLVHGALHTPILTWCLYDAHYCAAKLSVLHRMKQLSDKAQQRWRWCHFGLY